MRDCCSIATCNKRWLEAARGALYEDIQLVGPDSAAQRKKYRGVYFTRLVLLRRSIRANPQIAEMVRILKVPALPDEAPVEAEGYHDIVASVVMACPNLERLDGFYPAYNHSDSRLVHALSTRRKLKERVWIIDGAPAEVEFPGQQLRPPKSKSRQPKHPSSSERLSHPFNYLPVHLANNFVRHHMDWSELTHLTIHGLPGASLYTPNGLINVVLSYLTSLESLYLSDVPATSFDDFYLMAMPRPLKKLSLSRCPGVTTAGLATFVTLDAAQDLETLTLIHQNVDSLPAVVRILSKLTRLTSFSLVQAWAPTPEDGGFCFMPYVASRSLKKLHWDVFEGAASSRADDVLARSIAAGGFPSLRFLRTPCDADGRFQSLCRPMERVGLPGDRFRPGAASQAPSKNAAAAKQPPHNGSAADLEYDSRSRSSCDTRDSGKALGGGGGAWWPPAREAGSDLLQARLAAQARLEAARKVPRIEFNVEDEDGVMVESMGLAGYMGDVSSRIAYSLSPDRGGTDARGGLVGIAELLGDGGEDLCCGDGEQAAAVAEAERSREKGRGKKGGGSAGGGEMAKVRDGCTGRWNSYYKNDGPAGGSKASGGDGWWHTERGRWRGRVDLS